MKKLNEALIVLDADVETAEDCNSPGRRDV